MLKNDDIISPYQLALIIIMTVIGVGIFSLPAVIAKTAGPDSWFMILLGGFLNTIAVLIIVKLCTKFPGKTLADFAPALIGKLPAKLLLIIFSFYLYFIIAYELREFNEALKMFLLFRTPTEVIIFSLIAVCAYLVRGGAECTARIVEVTFFILFIPFILIVLLGLQDTDMSNLLPVFQDIQGKILKSLPQMALSFVGFEFLIFYIGFMKDPKKAYKPAVWAMIFITVFYTFVVIVCIGKFGTKFVTKLIWPVLSYIRAINLPGLFLERLDGVVLGLWVVTVFTTVAIAYYLASFCMQKIIGTREQKQFVVPISIIIYFFAMQPDDLEQLHKWGGMIFQWGSILFAYLIPVLLLIIAAIRKQGVNNNEKA